MSTPERRLPWTRPGSHVPTPGNSAPAVRSASAPAPPATLWSRLHLDDFTKIIALAGGLLYAVLFMAYRAYYDVLNLSPEDVGVDTTYVLVRSPGFVLMTLVALLTSLLYRLTQHDPRKRSVGFWGGFTLGLIRGVLLGIVLIVYFAQFLGLENLTDKIFLTFIAVTIVVSVAVIAYLIVRPAETSARYAQFTVAAALTVFLPAIIVLLRAQSLGHNAADGALVEPMQVFGIVVLDVSAPRVRVLWSDPMTPHPRYFGAPGAPEPATGTLLGQTPSSIVVNLADHDRREIVRFDARQVILEFDQQ
jgi:hypothetical protein